jgi:hypothetical protein
MLSPRHRRQQLVLYTARSLRGSGRRVAIGGAAHRLMKAWGFSVAALLLGEFRRSS